MDAISLADVRHRLDQIAEEAEVGPVYITRPGAETLMMLSARELASTNETAHLLSTDANRASLSRALKDVEAGRTCSAESRCRCDDLRPAT